MPTGANMVVITDKTASEAVAILNTAGFFGPRTGHGIRLQPGGTHKIVQQTPAAGTWQEFSVPISAGFDMTANSYTTTEQAIWEGTGG